MHISLLIETVYKDLEDIHTRTALKKNILQNIWSHLYDTANFKKIVEINIKRNILIKKISKSNGYWASCHQRYM